MATTIARLQAVLSANTRDFDKAMHTSEGRMKSIGKAGALAAGAAGVGAIAITLKAGIKEYTESQKVQAKTNAVLKSMGKTAGVTAEQVGDLATSIMSKTGIDDEAIQSGENLLLTFRNVRNEAGKGNDVFTQATHIMTDFSVTFGKSVPQSAVLVGKALNDPIKGLTALGRVGVQFTEGQKKQIKALVESGHTMQAQKIIMAELSAETKGSAEAIGKTLPGQINIAKETFNNWAGMLVEKMIPAITTMVTWIKDHWPEITTALKNFWKDAKPILVGFKDIIKAIYDFVHDHWSQIGPIVKAMAKIVEDAMKILGVELKLIAALLKGDWSEAWRQMKALMRAVYDFMKDYFKPQILLLKAAFEALGKLGKGIWGDIKDAAEKVEKPFKAAAGVIQKAVSGLRNEFHTLWGIFGKIIDGFKWLIDKGKAIIGFFGKLGGAVGDSGNRMKGTGDAIGSIQQGSIGPGAGAGAGAGSRFHVGRQLWDEIGMGQKLGLAVTSGYRPGAITKHGTPSDHGVNPSRAVDMAGTTNAMAQMFNWLVGRREIRQAFFDPMGSIFGGVRSSYREGGHSDHIHIAEYDKGGWLQPGLTLAANYTGRPERVGGGDIIIPVNVGGENIATIVFDQLRRKAKVFENRNGRPAFGGA